MARLSVGPVWDGPEVVIHTTHPATPPAMPERITWSADFILESSELIQVQCTDASRPSMWGCGGFTWNMFRCSGSLRAPVRIVRHVIQASNSKAKSDVKMSRLSKDRTVRVSCWKNGARARETLWVGQMREVPESIYKYFIY
jgi:hypothetical protein